MDSNYAALLRAASRRNQLISGFELPEIWSTTLALVCSAGATAVALTHLRHAGISSATTPERRPWLEETLLNGGYG